MRITGVSFSLYCVNGCNVEETVIERNDLNGIGIGTVKTVWHKFEVLESDRTAQNWSEHELFVHTTPVCAQLVAMILFLPNHLNCSFAAKPSLNPLTLVDTFMCHNIISP